MNGRLTIGQLAKLTGVPPKTIRYYEEAGILPPPERSESRYRLYSETDVRRLQLVRRARALDISLPDVLKSEGVWLMGRRLEINEVKRVLDQLPTRGKPTKDLNLIDRVERRS